MIRNKERGVNFIIQEKREHEIKEICDNFFPSRDPIQLIDTMVINFVSFSFFDPFRFTFLSLFYSLI